MAESKAQNRLRRPREARGDADDSSYEMAATNGTKVKTQKCLERWSCLRTSRGGAPTTFCARSSVFRVHTSRVLRFAPPAGTTEACVA